MQLILNSVLKFLENLKNKNKILWQVRIKLEDQRLLLRLKLSHQGKKCLISINLHRIARKLNRSKKIKLKNKIKRIPNQFKKNKMNFKILLEKNYSRKKNRPKVNLENLKNKWYNQSLKNVKKKNQNLILEEMILIQDFKLKILSLFNRILFKKM